MNFATFFRTLQIPFGPNDHSTVGPELRVSYNTFTKVVVQPWVLGGDLSFSGHQQVVFVTLTSDKVILIRDTDGFTGITFNEAITASTSTYLQQLPAMTSKYFLRRHNVSSSGEMDRRAIGASKSRAVLLCFGIEGEIGIQPSNNCSMTNSTTTSTSRSVYGSQ